MISSNIRRIMARSGMTIRDVVSATGLNERTIKSLLTGTQKPHARTLHKLAAGLGVEADALFARTVAQPEQTFDRRTNRVVREVMEAEGELFEEWTDEEIEELFSRFGTGGELTESGVIEAANALNRRRGILTKATVLMETDEADHLAEFIEMLYRRATEISEE